MKTTVLALALALAGLLSLSAAPLKGNFLLSADSTVPVTNMISFSKGHASLVSNSKDSFRVSADEITLDQSELTRTGVTLITCRGVTSVSAGYTIPASKELTLEIEGGGNIYRLNPAGIVVQAPLLETEKKFSQTLPKLDLRLRSGPAAP
jgi:hypothetical protein